MPNPIPTKWVEQIEDYYCGPAAGVMILNGVWMWNEFFIPLIIAIKPETQTLPVGIMAFVGVYSTEWGLVFASVVVSALPVVVAYVLLTRQFVAGISAGAIKG